MNAKHLISGLSLLLLCTCSLAQNISINETGLPPNVHAILDVDAVNNDKGILIPRLRTIERLAITGLGSEEEGLTVYDVSLGTFWYWNGMEWKEIGDTTKRLIDMDEDTEVTVEESSDEDIIRFYLKGLQKMVLNRNANDESRLELFNTSGSVFIGESSGNSNWPTGQNNTALGVYSMYANTEGMSNTALGANALGANTTGSFNTAIGEQAMLLSETSSSNTAVGYSALRNNTQGTGNSAFGANALRNNNDGNNNIAFGGSALLANLTGDQNIAIGKDALKSNTDGIRSVAIGFEALGNATSSQNIAIGSHALKEAPDGSHNIAIGIEAMMNNSGSNNTAVGHFALSDNNAGFGNTAFGFYALHENTASFSTAVGNDALSLNTTGERNTALGYAALNQNTTGHQNVAIGNEALLYNYEGYQNVAIGSFALSQNGNGIYNVSIGSGSGPYVEYDFCTFVGAEAGADDLISKQNAMALGYGATVTADDQVRIGNSSVSSIGGQVSWTTLSDGRFKKNINSQVPGLDFILKLRPVTYHLDLEKLNRFLGRDSIPEALMKSRRTREAVLQTGFIAQEVEQVAEQIGYSFSGIDQPQNEADPYGLRYAEFVPPLIKAVQEQQDQIHLLTEENASLKGRIAAIEMLLAEITGDNH